MSKKKSATSQLRPADDRLLVKRVESSETSPGGIVLPESAKKEKTQFAVIKTVGWGFNVTAYEIGQTVLIYKHAGVDLEFDGETVTIIDSKDVLATVK